MTRRSLLKISVEYKVALLAVLTSLLLSACRAAPNPPTLPASQTLQPNLTATKASTPTPTPTSLPSRTATLPPTNSPTPQWQVCSPLQDINIADLPGMLVNPYQPPAFGSDLPHQGVDLAERGTGQIALAGLPVQAVLAGQVALVLNDRFPYGNAVIVETRLDGPPESWLAALQLPAPIPTLTFIPALTCPPPEPLPAWSDEERSIYLLYAHLRDAPAVQVDEQIGCAQELGAIGDSGNALNPHLHLEARIGPSGVRLGSLAHYDGSATPQEMANYCIWRVSGWFQHFDPLVLFNSP